MVGRQGMASRSVNFNVQIHWDEVERTLTLEGHRIQGSKRSHQVFYLSRKDGIPHDDLDFILEACDRELRMWVYTMDHRQQELRYEGRTDLLT
jgi:hypothetical protein